MVIKEACDEASGYYYTSKMMYINKYARIPEHRLLVVSYVMVERYAHEHR
jgi:hypothetical protein